MGDRCRAEQGRAGPNQQKERAVKPDSSLCQVQFHQSLLTSKRVELMMGYHLLVLMVAGLASSHEYFPEKCPEFQPMQGFDWDQFSNGVWSWTPTTPATRSSALV